MNSGSSSSNTNNESSFEGSQENSQNSSSTSSSEGNSTSSSEGNSTESEVRFLSLQTLPSGEAIAMWAAPNGSQCQTQYTAELSFDGQTWRKLTLEQPFATWAMFPIQQQQFEVRVTPEHGMPMIANSNMMGKQSNQQSNQQSMQQNQQNMQQNQQNMQQNQQNMQQNQQNMQQSKGKMQVQGKMNNQNQQGQQQFGQQNQQQQDLDFLFVQNLSPSEGLAMWADSNSTACQTQYTAEISYDGKQWRKLTMDHPTDTWVTMSVTPGSQFQIRVTAQGEAGEEPMIGMSKGKGGKNGKAKQT